MLLGKLPEAEAKLRSSSAEYHRMGDPRLHGGTLIYLGLTLLAQGRLEEARLELELSVTFLERTPSLRASAHARANVAFSAKNP